MPARSQRHAIDVHGEFADGNKGYKVVCDFERISLTHPNSQAIDVHVYDYEGNPVNGLLVTLVSSDAGVATDATPTDTTDANGLAEFTIASVAAGNCLCRLRFAGAGNDGYQGSIYVHVE